jgi:hypothetical protein
VLSTLNQNDPYVRGIIARNERTRDGVCLGWCLDWVRRVLDPRRRLRSGFGNPRRSAFYNSEESFAKIESRLVKVCETHFLATMLEDDRHARTIFEIVCMYFGKTAPPLASASSFNASLNRAFVDPAERDQALQMTAALHTLLDEKVEDLNVHYDDFRRLWKRELTKNGRPRKSTFDSIHIIRNQMNEPFVSAGPLLGSVLWNRYLLPAIRDDVLSLGSAALLIVRRLGFAHTMALYLSDNQGEVYLFDPNCGEYCFPRSTELGQFFVLYWDTNYHADGYNQARIFELA